MAKYRAKLGKSEVEYDSETGEFRWVIAYRKPSFTGASATHKLTNGYLYIKAGGKQHSASRLALTLVFGPIPGDLEADHVNRVRDDNRICNLRLATRSQNMMHTELPPNRTGVRGVSIHRKTGLYRARFRDQVRYFKTLCEAKAGYATLVAKELESHGKKDPA